MKTFKDEINLGRPRLALVALVPVLEELVAKVAELENKIAGLTSDSKEDVRNTAEAEKPVAKKPAAKKAAAPKEEVEATQSAD